MTTTKTRKPTEITSAAIFRCTAKQSFTEKNVTIEAGETFYRVNSDTTNDSYIVRWNEEATQWECNCPSTRSCKHCRAAGEVCRDRKQFQPAAILAKHAATFNQDIVAFLQRAVAAKVEAQPASTSIGEAMTTANEQIRTAIEEAAVAGDRSYNDVIDAAYEQRAVEIATKKIAYRIMVRDARYFPQHQYPNEAWDCFWTGRAFLNFPSAYEAQQHLATYYGAHDVEVMEEPTYCSSCGKLSKREVCYHCVTGR